MTDFGAVVCDVNIKQPDELSFVDEDIRELFDGCCYVMGMPLMAQLIKELRLWRQARTNTELAASPRGLHEAVKERMRQRNPSLMTQLSRENIVQLMDELSEEIAERNRFATWQEAEPPEDRAFEEDWAEQQQRLWRGAEAVS